MRTLNNSCGDCRGLTLLELLVALSIMALMATVTVVALRVGINAQEGVSRVVESSRRDYAVREFITKQVNGMVPIKPYVGMGYSNSFFFGSSDGMRFVSRYSLVDRAKGGLVLAEYRFDMVQGRVGLLYRETKISTLTQLTSYLAERSSAEPGQPLKFIGLDDGAPVSTDVAILQKGTWFMLFADLSDTRIEYYVNSVESGNAAWVASWLGDGGYLPKGLAIRARVAAATGRYTDATIAATIPDNARPVEGIPLYYY